MGPLFGSASLKAHVGELRNNDRVAPFRPKRARFPRRPAKTRSLAPDRSSPGAGLSPLPGYHPIFGGMVTISISIEALAAIAATLPDGRKADRRSDWKGGFFVTLPYSVVDRLNYVREPGQSYSDGIIRIARGAASPW